MIELLFVACLASDPGRCRDQSLLYVQDIGLTACMAGAQAQLAQWSVDHPGQRIAEWRCQIVDQAGRAA